MGDFVLKLCFYRKALGLRGLSGEFATLSSDLKNATDNSWWQTFCSVLKTLFTSLCKTTEMQRKCWRCLRISSGFLNYGEVSKNRNNFQENKQEDEVSKE